MRKKLLLLLAVSLSLGSSARAQIQPNPKDHVYAIPAYEFVPLANDVTVQFVGGTGFSRNMLYLQADFPLATGQREFVAPVHLPDGAVPTGVQVSYCNDGLPTGGGFDGELVRARCTADLNCEEHPGQLISSGNEPGCLNVYRDVIHVPVDNSHSEWRIVIGMFFGDGRTRLGPVRVFYRTEATPAPATATFSDVPTTHPFFRFVEALTATGAIAGCGGGQFCPNTPVTRGQLAVILAQAFGLGW